MSRHTLIAGLSVLALSAGPAFAQTAPAQGTVQPRHVTHPAPPHKIPRPTATSADHSADDLMRRSWYQSSMACLPRRRRVRPLRTRKA